MFGPCRARRYVVIAAACLWLGCATTVSPAPPAWRRTSAEAEKSPWGGWANVTLRTSQVISGELIAVGDDAVYLGAHPRLYRLPLRCVTFLRVAAFDASTGPVIGYGTVGTVSTVSHGLFLILSAPVWLMSSAGIAVMASWAGHRDFGDNLPDKPRDAAKFARFPQGVRLGYIQRVARRETLDADCKLLSPQGGAP